MIRSAIVAAWISLSVTGLARAQASGAIETGLDGGVSSIHFDQSPGTLVTVSFPSPALRAGYFVTNRFEIEANAGYQRIKRENIPGSPFAPVDRVSQAGVAGLGVACSLGGAEKSSFFVRASGLVSWSGDDNPDTQGGFEGSIGYKAHLASHWAARMEGSFGKLFERGPIPAALISSFTVGFSYFSR